MKKQTVFLFDLDSTVTTQEILPEISKKINKQEEMRELTEQTMMGKIDFEESFRKRVKILSEIPVSSVADLISNIGLSQKIVNFINDNKDSCYIVTSNLNVWINKLIKKIGLEDHCFCSEALVENDTIVDINRILSKEEALKKFSCEIVAIGDGSNDFNMLKEADISVAYGGVRNVAPVLLDVADYVIYDESKLVDFLYRLV